LSGDFIVDQHIHNIDIINWIKRSHPVRAHGAGGRERLRYDKTLHGQTLDYHFVLFEYADGSKLASLCRDGQPTDRHISEHVCGTKGRADLNVQGRLFRITGPNAWELHLKQGEDGHQLEHFPLIDAIRNDKAFNELEAAAMSTMTAIMGRMATYSGKLIEWDAAINSKLHLMPEKVTWEMTPPVIPDADGNYPVAAPGRTQPV
jgi:predicted dehydrogenase